MILNEAQMTQLGSVIIGKSISGNMRWSIGENKRFVAALPGQYFVEVGSELAKGYVVEVKGPDDDVLGRLIGSDDNPGLAGGIYSAAESQAGTSVFQEIMDSLRFADEVKAYVVPRVSPDDVAEVRALMAGKWHLNYTLGSETAVISADGTYTITGNPAPAFTLNVLAWDKKSSTTEVAKDVPGGNRRQIEYLTITQQAMKGHAKHDGRKLSYTRTMS